MKWWALRYLGLVIMHTGTVLFITQLNLSVAGYIFLWAALSGTAMFAIGSCRTLK
jgi:hypothetical protein